jgi:hypothetical protein
MTGKIVWRSAVILVILAALSACGGGDDPPPPASFTVSATVSGLTGSGLVLRNNGGNDLAVPGNGVATFTNTLTSGANYNVTVATQPSAPSQTCNVTNGAGAVANSNVSTVAVSCIMNSPDAPVVSLSSDTKRHSLQWAPSARATFYRVYKTRSTDTDYQLISGDLVAQTLDVPVAVHLEDWAHLRYRVDACNADGCTPSAPGIPASNLPLIGYFKSQYSGAGRGMLGRDMAISADGNTVAIGSVGDDFNKDGTGAFNEDSGAVFIYVRDTAQNTWVQQAYLKASDTNNLYQFGGAVSLSDDGMALVVGAAKPGPQPGSIYIFTRSIGTSWVQEAKFEAPNFTPDDHFGEAVAISGDGRTIVATAPLEDSSATGVSAVASTDTSAPSAGAAYVFSRVPGGWTQSAYIKASNARQGTGFGSTVAISSNGATIAVGAGGEDSSATGVNGDQNNTALPNSGAVYVFQLSGNTWSQEAYIKSPFPDADAGAIANLLGDSGLALSGDGNTLAVSSVREESSARGIDGDHTDMTMQSSGAVYVYVRDGGIWTHQAYVKASNTDISDQFGTSVDLSHDGNIMAVGAIGESSRAVGVGGDQEDDAAQDTGAVYVFRRAGSWSQVNYVHAHSTDPRDQFGVSLSLSGDGATMVVGADFEDGGGTFFNADPDDETSSQAGAAYIF